jgi:tetratricopeptide (TPR) repeat protein
MRLIFVVPMLLLAAAPDCEARKRSPRQAAPAAVPAPLPVDTKTADRIFVGGDYERAVALYTDLLAHPRLPPAAKEAVHLNRGYSHLRLRRFDLAAADLRQAIALNPAGEEAAAALFAVQNRDLAAKAPEEPAAASPAITAPTWGPLARMPGLTWIASTTKPTSRLSYTWGRLGITMKFEGKDAAGYPIDGYYFIDPVRNVMSMSYTHRGKTTLSDIDVAAGQLTELPRKPKARERDVTALQSDGTFNLLKQKRKGKDWETVSVATLMPASAQMVAALDWPDAPDAVAAPEKKPSFLKSMLGAMKEGALAGFRDGMTQGTSDAAAYRVRQATGTKICRTVGGDIVKCP